MVRAIVEAKNPASLPKLVEGLKQLARSDPMVQCTSEESRSTSSWESGELHLEICLKDVEDHVCIPIKRNLTQLSHTRRLSASSRTCSALSKSPTASVLHEGKAFPTSLAKDIDKGRFVRQELKQGAHYLAENYE